MTTSAQLTGWAHTPFGRSSAPDVESLMGEVAAVAIADAGLDATDIGFVSVGVYGSGFSSQSFDAALVGSATPELAKVPAVRAENACATGSAALFAALDAVASGRVRAALVIGAEKMTGVSGAEANEALLGACLRRTEARYGSFAAIFAELARRYADRYGDQRPALARIAAKNHRNGVDNPYAHVRKDLGIEFCATESDRNPLVAAPLLRTDCSMISDGAAAVVVASADVARTARRAVAWHGRAQANDPLAIDARADPLAFDGARRAFTAALAEAGVSLADLDLIETHDCFTQAELLQYEAFGLAEPGKGATVLADGITHRDGSLPVNVSGGLKAKGHPIGATGVSQHVMAAMQLVGEAGAMQLPRADRAAVFNMGGAAVANYASVLEVAR
ncbi:thiolase domain-containing protein [Streptomyces sp. NBC_01186]|uniref:thiolase domain-containing protein n=1 Tax=unclassified Streptomyces TaxID=2593676 RepID=UPI002DD8DE06|nr:MULTISPECIES: thiolase domain-containing protein [unclassified Streptomyces]WSB75033.1 thiolase domain-containing protein [Streptomyces sp. NBC_01775]WSS16687.1 thiolase domain-containing protein [Streptomyces sp. NBC_01186]